MVMTYETIVPLPGQIPNPIEEKIDTLQHKTNIINFRIFNYRQTKRF